MATLKSGLPDLLAKVEPRCRNLGLHLLVATAEVDVVAICVHPLGIREAEESHAILSEQGVPILVPDVPVTPSVPGLQQYRTAAYLAARDSTGGNTAKMAAQLGVSERTLRNWRKKGVV